LICLLGIAPANSFLLFLASRLPAFRKLSVFFLHSCPTLPYPRMDISPKNLPRFRHTYEMDVPEEIYPFSSRCLVFLFLLFFSFPVVPFKFFQSGPMSFFFASFTAFICRRGLFGGSRMLDCSSKFPWDPVFPGLFYTFCLALCLNLGIPSSPAAGARI